MMHRSDFKPSNVLTFKTAQFDMDRFIQLLNCDKTNTIRLDLNQVTQCDSAGLALLVEAQRLCKKYKKNLAIDGVSEEIKTLAEFCGVQEILRNDR